MTHALTGHLYAVVSVREVVSVPYRLTSLRMTLTNKSPSRHYASTQTTLPNCASTYLK